MFCDLVDSTELSTRRDPEDLREIIAAYHRCCAEHITRADGFVAKYMGDGVLAYFGYPQAHEDDAEGAVRAGLALIEAMDQLHTSERLQARVGIATGLVVVGDLLGAGAAQEQAVVGDLLSLGLPMCKGGGGYWPSCNQHARGLWPRLTRHLASILRGLLPQEPDDHRSTNVV
jgi:class 3 adenylate cyclase